eukprot:gene1674-2875_t
MVPTAAIVLALARAAAAQDCNEIAAGLCAATALTCASGCPQNDLECYCGYSPFLLLRWRSALPSHSPAVRPRRCLSSDVSCVEAAGCPVPDQEGCTYGCDVCYADKFPSPDPAFHAEITQATSYGNLPGTAAHHITGPGHFESIFRLNLPLSLTFGQYEAAAPGMPAKSLRFNITNCVSEPPLFPVQDGPPLYAVMSIAEKAACPAPGHCANGTRWQASLTQDGKTLDLSICIAAGVPTSLFASATGQAPMNLTFHSYVRGVPAESLFKLPS